MRNDWYYIMHSLVVFELIRGMANVQNEELRNGHDVLFFVVIIYALYFKVHWNMLNIDGSV